MKLLFNQNLSFKLAPILDFVFPGSKHVKDFGLTGQDDEAIWQLALEQSFVIVSKDSDFMHRSLLRRHPLKVIQVRVRNGFPQPLHELFTWKEEPYKRFLNNPNEALLVIGAIAQQTAVSQNGERSL